MAVMAIVWLLYFFVNCASARRPNFVLMVADDLGYGDLSSFGNTTLLSPNIDRLASEGTKLTHTLAAAAVCTPSRAAFLTGRYPGRSGMAPSGFASVFLSLAQPGGLPASEVTFAAMVKEVGYRTALIGKWHQGLDCWYVGDKCHHPHTHGFDFFYGLPYTNMAENEAGRYSPTAGQIVAVFWYIASGIGVSMATALWAIRRGHRLLGWVILVLGVFAPIYVIFPFLASRRLNSVLMRDDVVVEQPIHMESLTRRFVRETLRFIEENDNSKTPFLIFLSFTHVHVHLAVQPSFRGRSRHGAFGDAVIEMDWAVGRVLEALERRGIRNDTFVLFTSDHGAHVEEAEDEALSGNNGVFSGGKGMHGMEGGIRVPAMVSWPGRIKPGVISTPVSLMDIFPTIARLANASLPTGRVLDGRDLGPLLFGPHSAPSPHKVLFHHGRAKDVHAMTLVHNDSLVWKIHLKQPRWRPGTRRCKVLCRCRDSDLHQPEDPLIYNIKEDPSEIRPIPTSHPAYQEVLAESRRALERHLATIVEVPEQLTIDAFLWRPWLQPWCSFPFRTCQEEEEEVT